MSGAPAPELRGSLGAPPALGEHDGLRTLLLGGAVQSVLCDEDSDEPEGYWRYLVPDEAPSSVLVLGLGGGTVVQLLRRRFPGASMQITGVDDDPAVLELGAAEFGSQLAGVRIVRSEAAAWLKGCRQRGERFDLVVVDLFRAGAVPGFVTHRNFLGRAAAVLNSGGILAINLNRGGRRPAQLRAVLQRYDPVRAVGAGMNLVVRALAKPRRRYRRRPVTR